MILMNNKRKQVDSISEEQHSDTTNKQYKMSSSDSSAEIVALDTTISTTTITTSDPASYAPNKKIPQKLTEWLQTFYNWSHNERITALDSLVTSEICEVQQMRHLLSLIEPQLQRDFISLLPKELSLYVLSFLDPSDLLSAAQTCRYWRILCEDNLLWREKCREEGLLDDHECFSDFLRSRLAAAAASNTCSNFNTFTSSDESSSSQSLANLSSQNQNNFYLSDYKLAYLRHKSIEFNWRYGELNYNSELEQTPINNNANNNQVDNQPAPDNSNQSTSSKACQAVSLPKNSKPRRLKEILHLKGHEDHVITCLQFNPSSNIIVSGSDDNTLKVWSSITGRCLRTLNGHTGGVWSSQLSPENIVISGSTDRTLRVWNALNGQCLHVLYGHTSTVRCMALHGKYVVSGSRDATLRVWNIETGGCDHVLVGHLAAVRCVQFNGTLCVSGAYDFLVKVWDVASETCLHTLEGHTNRVYSLQFDGIHIVSGSLDTSIRVWSADTGKLKHTLIGHQSLTSGMQLRSNILVSGNADSTVKVWDINTGQCLQTLSGNNKHQSAVTCLQFNSNFVITSSDDGTVKLWDLKTGDFIRNLVSLPSGGSGGVVWRIRASNTKLVCAVGSRNGTEETKLLVLDFETPNTSFDYEMRSISCEFFTNSPSQTVLPSIFDGSIESLEKSPSAVDCLNQLGHCANTFQVAMENSESTPGSNESTNQSESSSGPTSTSSSAMSSLSSTPSSSQIFSISSSLQSINSSNPHSKSCSGKISPSFELPAVVTEKRLREKDDDEDKEEETIMRNETDLQQMEQDS